MKRKPGRPKKSAYDKRESRRVYATLEEHARIKEWLSGQKPTLSDK